MTELSCNGRLVSLDADSANHVHSIGEVDLSTAMSIGQRCLESSCSRNESDEKTESQGACPSLNELVSENTYQAIATLVKSCDEPVAELPTSISLGE